MNQLQIFSRIFLMMPRQEAAQCLLLFTQEEQLELLEEVTKNNTNLIPSVIADNLPPSLAVFQSFARRTSEILMALAEQVGDSYVNDLLNAWGERQPQIFRELRSHIFFFEEVLYLSDRAVQMLLREQKLSKWMLVHTSSEVREKLLRNVSKRVAQEVRVEFTGLGDVSQSDPEVYRVKAQFSQMVLRFREVGEIDAIEYPLPELLCKAFERDVRWIAEQVMKMDYQQRYNFLRDDVDDRLLKFLFQSSYGDRIKDLILPMLSVRLRVQAEELLAQPNQRLTFDDVQRIADCRQQVKRKTITVVP